MKSKGFWLLLAVMVFSAFLLVAACGDDDDDDNDTSDDDTADDDAADDDAADDDVADDDSGDDDDDDNDVVELFSEDFESYTAGDPLGTPWVVTLTGESYSTIFEANDTSYGNCLENVGSVLAGESAKAVLGYTGAADDLAVTFDYWVDADAYGRFWLSNDGGTTVGAGVATIPGGALYANTAGGFGQACGSVISEEWNTISILVNYAAGTYDVEINGDIQCEDVDAGLGADVTYNAIVLDDSILVSEGGYYYFDNILGKTQ